MLLGKLEQVIFELLAPSIASLGYELLGIEYLPQGKHSVLRLFVDSDDGIQLGDCEKVSRQVSGILDVEDPLKGQYSLEVSSPGMERPLFTSEQFAKFIDARVRIKLQIKHEGRKRITGLVKAVEEDVIVIHDSDDDIELRINITDMDRAQLIPDWD